MGWLSSCLTVLKSLLLKELASSLRVNYPVRFVCLQYHATPEDAQVFEEYSGQPLYFPKALDTFNDLDGLAAAISACDYVVTSSNITAHLVGGLGKAGSVLLPRGNGLIWYWGVKDEQTPWYPSLKLIRQTQRGDWHGALAILHEQISSASLVK